MGTGFTKMLKCKGPNGSQEQNPLAFCPHSCLGLPKHMTCYGLLPFEILCFLGFIKTLGFFCCYWLLLFLNLLNMDFLKVQSLVFCFFFFLDFRKHTRTQDLMTSPILLSPTLTFVLSFSPCSHYQKNIWKAL